VAEQRDLEGTCGKRLGARGDEESQERLEGAHGHARSPGALMGKTLKVAIPSGTVTLVFTDIEGSTLLWEQFPEPMATALERHDALIRSAIESAGGYVFKTVGDAFCAVFASAKGAVAAAAAAQVVLHAEAWPEQAVLRVRMALHTGECEERDGDFYGPAVNRAARLEAIAHGGQVVVSQATAILVRDRLPPGTQLIDLGSHRLKDLNRPEEVFQLEVEGVPARFPPLRSQRMAAATNLTASVSSFVGREAEVGEVIKLLDESRLVTLTGAGGVGKTRLALQVAAELVDNWDEGVWLVELASLADPNLAVSAIASVLKVRQQPDEDLIDTVVGAVANRKLLLVLDNCEHLLDACARLMERLVPGCIHVRALLTSREPLRIAGEQVYRVPSLSVPPEGSLIRATQLSQFDAVRLFADRGAAHQTGFVVDEGNCAVVASICRRLDGIPLALELAAARMSSLSIAEIDRRLDDRFRLLTVGTRTSLPRHRTLEALINWSVDLLDQREQLLFSRMSVFAGGCSLETAEEVCSGRDLESTEVIDVLGSLVDKSLVQAEQHDTEVRYSLLESVRQYAAKKLLQQGGMEETILRRAHAQAFLAMAEALASPLPGTELSRWFDRLEREHDNLSAAMRFLLSDQASTKEALRIAVSLRHFWFCDHRDEGAASLEEAIARVDFGESPGLGAVGLLCAGYLRFELGSYGIARAHLEKAAEVARSVGDLVTTAEALGGLGLLRLRQGDLATALELVEESVDLAVSAGNAFATADAFNHRATVRSACGEPDADVDFSEALARFRIIGDHVGLARTLQNLAVLELKQGDVASARTHIEDAIRLRDGLHGMHGMIDLHLYQGLVELLAGNGSAARQAFLGLLSSARRAGALPLVAYAYLGLGICMEPVRNLQRAAMLHGFADALFEERGEVIDAGLRALCDMDRIRLREELGESAFEDAYLIGRKLSPDSAIALAFDD